MALCPPISFVRSVKDRCRVCYTCVRECPARAVRINQSQAEVVPSRCIGCGNCVKVCSQGAKRVVSTVQEATELIASDHTVVACIAPSFAAELSEDLDFRVFVGMVKSLGFDLVCEVAFGADLIAERYRQLMAGRRSSRHIATTCPSVVGYIERYHPELVENLTPLVSPMVATARALRHLHSPSLKVVFLGPCIGKKAEAASPLLRGEVNAAITFVELWELLEQQGITPDTAVPMDFDQPHPGLGSLFSLSRGSLQAAGLNEDLVSNEVVSADGVGHFTSAIKEFFSGQLEPGLLEVLCCNGCIMGPGMRSDESMFVRRARVGQYAKFRLSSHDEESWQRTVDQLAGIDLSRQFEADDQRLSLPSDEQIREILVRMGKHGESDELNCGACGYPSCEEHAISIHKGLAESEMCLPYTIGELQKTVGELKNSNSRLKDTQEQLMHTERLASMGQLAAGVAHELNNPLGVVLMYAHLLFDDLQENPSLGKDVRMIVEQADRCKRIVANLLDFARENKVLAENVDATNLVSKSLSSVPVPGGITVQTEFSHSQSHIEVDPEQIGQVLTNLVSNSYAAMPDGGALTVTTWDDEQSFFVKVADTGLGIPEENLEKVFQPFFTTKSIGKGTGLGLAVAYGIVKMHKGSIKVTSRAIDNGSPSGTTFEITLPRNGHPNEVLHG